METGIVSVSDSHKIAEDVKLRLLLNNEGLDFIADYAKPFGIVTTKQGLLKKASAKEEDATVKKRRL